MSISELSLRYGTNPHQTPARVFIEPGQLPIQVLGGAPGYINLLDALNGWQLVRELKRATGLPAATSFKHVSPAGAAVAVPLDETLRRAYFIGEQELSPLAAAYARARGADRVASFGDFVALSDTVDVPTAQVLRREVSDGIIAPGYDPEALAVLAKKHGGKYIILQVDAAYEPPAIERREVFGITFEQRRNDASIGPDILRDRVTADTSLTPDAERDMMVALITLKYTQSNSVGLARDGQMIGIGAGQQSRILCTRLACSKADHWHLRQHPSVLDLPFAEKPPRPERDNAIDLYLGDQPSPDEEAAWLKSFRRLPQRLSAEEKSAWREGLHGVTLGSDGFIPFRDNIDRAAQSGVAYVVQPGHSLRDPDVIAACNEYGMVMAFTGLRLFHH
ncbi:MAG: phosphoribosylaminoimidazolecarboxamide formyltransferase [Armatimonadetes bacterium]|nr:phosphoribosylaminoimidazolecarboxamide formyltransferase [Armatimonadota bacterium]